MKMPATREEINVSLVSQLVAEQFPQWADLPIRPVEFDGWDNRTFRLGEELTVRLPSAEAYAREVEKEQNWLPRLAPFLPLFIPVPVAMGLPGDGLPCIGRSIGGSKANKRPWIASMVCNDLRSPSLDSLWLCSRSIRPVARHPESTTSTAADRCQLMTVRRERRLQVWVTRIDVGAATAVWEAALNATWQGPAVWHHGDVAAGNLLVREGRLNAIIDFGCSGVGDPACDLTIAWTFLSGESREAFRAAIRLDAATWARARGWTLWKALITYVRERESKIQKHTLWKPIRVA